MPNENTLPTPETRREMFLAAAAGESVEKPEPITREEMFLNAISGGGSGDAYTKEETDELLDGKADIIDGKIPAAQLPSYVDDTVEGYYYNGDFYEDSEHTTAITGESGKIYIDLMASKSYRWTGNVYVRIDECPAFGETAGTIYEGNKGKANADAIAKKPGEITTGKQYTISGQTVTAGTGAEAFNDLANNKATGQYSHAEGEYTTASGGYSHAEGYGTTASGNWSHAEGLTTTASGSYSHAEGYYTKAYGNYSHAEGKYNVEDSTGTYAFIIGNGTAGNARHNAFAIDWNGLIYVNGAATGVDVSALAPQSEVDTALASIKDGTTIDSFADVETALAEKLNTSDIDATLSSTSTNPVQNKEVQAPIARLMDAGAKNLLNLNTTLTSHEHRGITYKNNNDGTIRVSGTSNANDSYVTIYDLSSDNFLGVSKGRTVVIASTSDDVSIGIVPKKEGGVYGPTISAYKSSPVVYTIPSDFSGFLLRVGVYKNGTTVNEDVNGMICTAEDYAISSEFVPYAPSNRELYEMILALQNAQNGG